MKLSTRNSCTSTQKQHPAPALLASFVLGYLAAHLTVYPLALSSAGGGRQLDRRVPSSTPSGTKEQDHGWKPIHVFYGVREHLEGVTIAKNQIKANTFFSQVKQDQVVSMLFREKRDGFFVDLAANDAVALSNTYALETHFNWSGVCIEPNAVYWPSLSYRKCHVVGGVAGGDREEVSFMFTKKGVFGGIVGDEFDNKDTSNNKDTSKRGGERQPRLTVTLEEILSRFDAPREIDYFSLDVEGAEGLILTQSALSHYTFKVLTIERPKKELTDLLTLNGYTNVGKLSTFGETLWVHKSAVPELDMSVTDQLLLAPKA